jgi:quercetin dioxygenase-like cupin family protein
MKESDFNKAGQEDRQKHIVCPYEEVPLTELVPGSLSHLIGGVNVTVSFLIMKAGSVFELHSHPQEQIMIVIEGYCDEIIEDKIYKVHKGDVIYLSANIKHGAFIREIDCKAIDIFSPPREDYKQKYLEQNKGKKFSFLY